MIQVKKNTYFFDLYNIYTHMYIIQMKHEYSGSILYLVIQK